MMVFKTYHRLPIFFALASFALIAATATGCKTQEKANHDAAAAASALAPTASAAPSLPPEPPPALADKVGEVPALEAALAKDGAYQSVWTGPRADLALFLSYVSELLATGGAPAPLATAVKTKKLQDAAVKAFMVLARSGKLPDDFRTKLGAHLDATAQEAHAGTWAAFTKGGAMHDYSALATWSRPQDARLLREHIASKQTGAGPFGWEAWQGKGDSPRPWLSDEGAALDRLALLTPLTAAEQARRQEVLAARNNQAAAKAEAASAVQVTASTLFDDYKANEVAADEKYKSKKLLVAGTVASIDKGGLTGEAIIVKLATSNQFLPVSANMNDDEKAKSAKLAKGDAVKVLCSGEGMMLGFVQLGDCVLR